MKPKRRPIRWLICLHESGHACAAVLLGIAVAQIERHIDNGMMAASCTVAPHEESDAERVFDAAGDVAVTLYDPRGVAKLAACKSEQASGERWYAKLAEICGTNDAAARKAVADARIFDWDRFPTGDKGDAIRRAACTLAAVLLMDHWEAVLIVADEMYRDGHVGGERIREIVALARGSWRPPVGSSLIPSNDADRAIYAAQVRAALIPAEAAA